MSNQSRRAYRGGSWSYAPAIARVANRDGSPPSYRSSILGFRLVEEAEEVDRVERGGSWGFIPALARAAYRNGLSPSLRYDYLGFRLVEEVEPGPGVGGPGKILVVHQIWENGTQSCTVTEFTHDPRPVGVVPVMVVESDSFVLAEKP